MVVARAGTGNLDSDFNVVQSNVDGAVVGPTTSVDNRIAVYDGATGKIIKDGGVTISSLQGQNATHTGDVTGATALTIGANKVTNTKLRDSAGVSVMGRSSNSTGDPGDIVAASDYQVLRRSGSVVGFGSIDLGQSGVSGTLPVTRGGTGKSNLTANSFVLGNGTNGVNLLAPGASGYFMTSNGSTASWTNTIDGGTF